MDPRVMGAVAMSNKELAVTESALRAVDVPVLSIIGSRDPLLPGVQDLAGVLPHHEIIVIEGGTHRTTARDARLRISLRRWFSGEEDLAVAGNTPRAGRVQPGSN
ncbi:MAG: hypothetical protein NTZ61_03405 [Proteobacteria bacterium]|nr:hypothetical protein [Pseudomonadota bacterium]